MSWQSARSECQAGDIIVTPSTGGYLLSFVLPQSTLGSWWKVAGLEGTRSDALLRARQLAAASEARVMLYESGRFRQVKPGSGVSRERG